MSSYNWKRQPFLNLLFKNFSFNPFVKSTCKVAVIGEDLNEINILSELRLPCKILLCSGHILHHKVTQQVSNAQWRNPVNSALGKLVYLCDDKSYEAHLSDPKQLLVADPVF